MSRYNFKTETYEDILEIDKEELIERMQQDFNRTDKPLGSIAKLMELFYDVLGLEVNNESDMFVLAEADRLLCEAPAGAGKTTISQLRLIKEKIINKVPGHKVLSIAFNEHAASDMRKRHHQMVSDINRYLYRQAQASAISQGKEFDIKKVVQINTDLDSRTFHSFIRSRLQGVIYMTKIQDEKNLPNGDTEKDSINLMKDALAKVQDLYKEKMGKDIYVGDPSVKASQLLSLTDYMTETMRELEEVSGTSKFMDLNLPFKFVKNVIKIYRSLQEIRGVYTHTDTLHEYNEYIKKNPEEVERLRLIYSVVLVDEYQDLSPIMIELLQRMFTDPLPNTPLTDEHKVSLTVIGDGDQSIYGFRGVDGLNTVKFVNDFPGGRVVTMTENRRCRKNILNVGKEVLKMNELRINKDIRSEKEGGIVEGFVYEDHSQQIDQVINLLLSMPESERNNTCISYRNRDSSQVLTSRLTERGISFKLGNGHEPYSDQLSKNFLGILRLLTYPNDERLKARHLFKVLPGIRKQQVYDEVKGSYAFFWKDFEEYKSPVVSKRIVELEGLSGKIRYGNNDKPMLLTEIMPVIREYLAPYWNFVKKNYKFSEALEEEVYKLFNREESVLEFLSRLDDYNSQDSSKGGGPYITTMHGLKGLEFDTLILIDMDDEIMPSPIRENEHNPLTDAEKQKLREEENRLFYVSVTRPKERLVVFWSKSNPSIYKAVVDGLLTDTKPKQKFSESNVYKVTDKPVKMLDKSKMGIEKDFIEPQTLTEPVLDFKLEVPEEPVLDFKLEVPDVPDAPTLEFNLEVPTEEELFLDLRKPEVLGITPYTREEEEPITIVEEQKKIEEDTQQTLTDQLKNFDVKLPKRKGSIFSSSSILKELGGE